MIIVGLVTLWALVIAAFVYAVFRPTARDIAVGRLEQTISSQVGSASGADPLDDEPGRTTFGERALRPILAWIAAHFRRAVRPRADMAEALRAAGRPLNLNEMEFAAMKLGTGALLAAVATVPVVLAPALRPSAVPWIACMGAIGFVLPAVVMARLASRRRFEMQLALPDMLDLVTLSVEAGMGFDGAVARACANTTGPLSEELSSVLAEVGQGRPRVEVFEDLAVRARIEEISLLVATVHQAERLGVSTGRALRDLGDQLREERVHRAREIIARLPVKMLFPLLVFIFPALFIVILGPAVVMMRQSAFMGLP